MSLSRALRATVLSLLAAGLATAGTPAAPAELSDARVWFASPLPWLLADRTVQWSARGSVALSEPQPFVDSSVVERIDRTRSSLLGEVAGGLGARVEGSVRFGATQTGGRDDSRGVVPSDTDIRIGYAILDPPGGSGALAAWLTAKAPTGPDKGGASTDEADLGFRVAAGARRGRAAIFASAGLELLGNPLRNGAQDDVAAWGCGLVWPVASRWSLTGEAEGRAFSRFGNTAARARLGLRWSGGAASRSPLQAGVVVFRGLDKDAAKWGAELLLSVTRF